MSPTKETEQASLCIMFLHRAVWQTGTAKDAVQGIRAFAISSCQRAFKPKEPISLCQIPESLISSATFPLDAGET